MDTGWRTPIDARLCCRCGDFSFYQFPSEQHWSKLFGSMPASLRYAFKIPEAITAKAFPAHPRYGPRAGARNESFLNAALLQGAFLSLLHPYRSRVAVLIFEFGTLPKSCYRAAAEFVVDLYPFLAALPHVFRYAVETRYEEFLVPDISAVCGSTEWRMCSMRGLACLH